MNKDKLLSLCFMGISIVLTVVISVQTWITTPIRFKGATEDMYIMRNKYFRCDAKDTKEGEYGYWYTLDSPGMSFFEKTKILDFISNLKLPVEVTLADKEYDENHYFELSTWEMNNQGNEMTGIIIKSCGSKYVEVKRSWQKHKYAPWEYGPKWYYEVGEDELNAFIDCFIAMSKKRFPKELIAS